MVGDRPVGGAMPPMGDGVPPHWNVYFNVASVDDTVAAAERLGGRVVAPPSTCPRWAGWRCWPTRRGRCST